MRRFHVLALIGLLFCSPSLAQERRTFTVPFESHAGLVFLKTTLDKKPVTLLLDTGSNVSFAFKDGAAIAFSGNGFRTLEEYPSRVVFRYPDQIKSAAGIIGQDVLRNCSAVRIDYKRSVVEFEK